MVAESCVDLIVAGSPRAVRAPVVPSDTRLTGTRQFLTLGGLFPPKFKDTHDADY